MIAQTDGEIKCDQFGASMEYVGSADLVRESPFQQIGTRSHSAKFMHQTSPVVTVKNQVSHAIPARHVPNRAHCSNHPFIVHDRTDSSAPPPSTLT